MGDKGALGALADSEDRSVKLAAGVGPVSDGLIGASLIDGKRNGLAVDFYRCARSGVTEGAVRAHFVVVGQETGSGLGVWGSLKFLLQGRIGLARPRVYLAADFVQVAHAQSRGQPAVGHRGALLQRRGDRQLPVG